MIKKTPKVSIIIPVIAVNDYIRESVPKILQLDWPDFEIIIFTDKEDKTHHWPKTTIISSGKVGPAEKRDLAQKYASGEILAFLDDDAYPESDWLKKAIIHFSDPKVAGVGGPAITPTDDDTLQKVSGAVFESYVGGASARERYLSIGKTRETNDWPTVNLLVRKDVFIEVGGFDNTYWPGEDTKLCLDIINKGYKIIHEPSAIVYHHRRSDLLKHFKQIGNYALHRGFFAKIYPKTSRKFFYLVPTLFDLYLIVLIFASLILNSTLLILTIAPLFLYLIALLIDGLIIAWRWKSVFVGLLTIPMVIATHVWYGLCFVRGLIVKKLAQ